MSKSYNDCLSTRIRHGNATPKEEALADAAPALLEACKRAEEYAPNAIEQGVLRAAIRQAEGGGE